MLQRLIHHFPDRIFASEEWDPSGKPLVVDGDVLHNRVPGHQEEAFLEVRVYQFVKIFVARFRFRINHLGGRAHAISLHWLPSNLHRGRVVSYNDYNRRKEPAILQLSTVEELMAK